MEWTAEVLHIIFLFNFSVPVRVCVRVFLQELNKLFAPVEHLIRQNRADAMSSQ